MMCSPTEYSSWLLRYVQCTRDFFLDVTLSTFAFKKKSPSNLSRSFFVFAMPDLVEALSNQPVISLVRRLEESCQELLGPITQFVTSSSSHAVFLSKNVSVVPLLLLTMMPLAGLQMF